MRILGITLNVWIDFIAALVSIAALITFALSKTYLQAYTLGVVLVAIVAGLLVISIFVGAAKDRLHLTKKDYKSPDENKEIRK